MTRKVRISKQADADLDAIANNIGSESLTAAIAVLDKLLETFLLLSENPEIGTHRDDVAAKIRMFSPSKPASNYIVFYYPMTDGVEISDIIHGAQDWIGQFSRGERGPDGP